ncbi:alginate lyase family protein [Aeribacillus sp. FSL K6-3256]|uniref:alginate lyase family protein n=1 Tax=Aeribacillus TaxID=1055323 RepID=UPI0030CF0551
MRGFNVRRKIHFLLIFSLVISIIFPNGSISIKAHSTSEQYFEVIEENVPVYKNNTGELIKIGELKKGQIFPFVNGNEDWYQIQFSDYYAYVEKINTKPTNGFKIKNKNESFENSNQSVKTLKEAVVYDNTSGELVPFALIEKEVNYKIVSEYGNWWRIIFGDRIGYVKKSEAQLNDGIVENQQEIEDQLDVNDSSEVLPSSEEDQPQIEEDKEKKESNQGSVEEKNSQTKNGDSQPTDEEKKKISDYNKSELTERQLKTDERNEKEKTKTQYQFSHNDKYFEVLENDLSVYDNRTGKLVKVGELKKGQVYPRVSDYGDWHRIQFSNHYGYVRKSSTKPIRGSLIKNENKGYKNSSQSVKTLKKVIVYENNSGKLVPFGTIEKGKDYRIVSDYGNWWRIIFSDRIGYIKKSEVQIHFGQHYKYFQTTQDNIPVYDNRTGKLVKIGELKKGQVYPRVSDYGDWHRIQFSNHYGYVRKSSTKPASGSLIKNENKGYKNSSQSVKALKNVIVYDNSSRKLVPFGTIEKGKDYRIVSDYGNWWKIIYSDRIGYIKKLDVQPTFSQYDKYFKVMEDNLPVYDNRSGKMIKIGELKKGQVYPRVSDYGNWHRIQFSDHYGYVKKSSTQPADGSIIKNKNVSFKNNGRRITPIRKTVVYDNSYGKLVPFGVIEKGKVYKVTSDYGNWWQIVYSDRVGYVKKSEAIAEFYKFDKYFEVIENNVPIYDNRMGKLIKVGELEKGQIYPRVSDYGDWHKIQFNDYYGYVRKSSTNYPTKKVVLPSENRKYKNLNSRFITTKKINVYDNTSGKLVKFGEIEEAVSYSIAFNYGNWWGIIYSGRIGYVSKKEVSSKKVFTVAELNNFYISRCINLKDCNNKANDNITQFYILPSTNYLESANNMLQNRYQISNYGVFYFPNGIKWDKALVSENGRSYLRALNGHFFLSDLIKSYEATRKKVYLEKGFKVIKDWINNNPYPNKTNTMAWHDETTARRLVQWIHFYHHAKTVLPKKDLEILLKNIIFHADLLSQDFFYSHNTNHGMFQDEALLAFSEYFKEYQDALYYQLLAQKRLKNYFDYIISAEGVHLEHSPIYHQIIAQSVLNYYKYFNNVGNTTISNYLLNKFNSMFNFSTFIIKPDGFFPAIGDTQYNLKPDTNIWKSNEWYQFAASAGKKGKPHPKTDMVFKKSGYAIFRDSWNKGTDSTYVLFTAAYHTGYHKHSDDLNMWIYSKGTDIIVEAGPNGYDYHNAFTEYGYSSFAHNTLIVNDKGLPRHDSQYKKVYIESYQLDKNKAKVRGVNERYKNVKHIRDIQYDKLNQMIEVNDTIQSSVRNNYKLLWHMAEGIEVELEKIHNNAYKVYLFKNENKIATIEVTSESKIELNIVKGQKNPQYLGWKLLINGNNIPINTLVISTNDDTTKINTKFILH